jgi:hypothetical protein
MTTTRLIAIDPPRCGCTECLVGEYRPLDQATDEDIRALFRGEIRDNTDETWFISDTDDGGFTVYVYGYSFNLDYIVLPIPVDNYRLDVSNKVIDSIWCHDDHLG